MLHFDIAAVVILVMLIASMFLRNMYMGKLNWCFLILMIVTFLTATADIVAGILDEYVVGAYGAKYAAHTAYLLFHNWQPMIFEFFVIAITDTWHTIRRHKGVLVASSIPFVVVVVSLIANFSNHQMFYYTDDGVYTHGEFFYLFYVSAIIYLAIGLTYLLKFRNLFSKARFSAFFSMFPLLAAATVVQYFYPDLWIEMFASAISLLYINLLIYRAEDVLDADSGLMSMSAYTTSLGNSIRTNKPSKIIIINVTNHDHLKKMMGYDNTKLVQGMISTSLTALANEMHLHSEIFYIGEGRYRVILAERSFHVADDVAHRINEAMKPAVVLNEMALNLVACVCMVDFPTDIPDVESLLHFGNELTSRHYNGQVLYAKDIYQQTRYEIMKDIDQIIEHALANHEFEVYYQPIYSVQEKRFTTAEALCRLRTKDGIFVSPDIFIPAAEKSGAIHKIGNYVLKEVCRFISSDDYKKLNINNIEVNLSITQCMQKGLAADVLRTLKKYSVDVSQINLEITETATSYAQNTVMENLNALSKAGIALSLDDFGTGYSNMMRIASMPLHIVKLDKTFSDAAKNGNSGIVIENTVRMIKELKMRIVVEGVETEELANLFSDLQCEYIQGFFYARPMPKASFVEFIEGVA